MDGHGKYKKRYNKSWEQLSEFSAWLTKNTNPTTSSQEAFCKFCEIPLRAHKHDLTIHQNTKKHRDNAARFVKQKKLASCGINIVGDITKSTELKLASFIAAHCSVKSVDHLSELTGNLGKKSDFEHIRLHRTKCSRLISNVIAPVLLEELVEDIGDKPYSLIIDESTDVSIVQHMAICVRYFSPKRQTLTTDFLGMVSLPDAKSETLFTHLIAYLAKIKLDIKNLISLGTDGASNMVGKNHSLFTLLRDRVPLPNLILIRCICHSLQLCSSNASTVFPAEIEYLVRTTRSWFTMSPKRLKLYKVLFDLINNNDKKMLALIELSGTRWLAWEGAVTRILDQCLELKTHFKIMAKEGNDNKCHVSRELARIYSTPNTLLYLIFLKSILKEVNGTNLLFQSSEEDIHKLCNALWTLILSVGSRILKPLFLEKAKETQNLTVIADALSNKLALKALKDIDYGVEFQGLVLKGSYNEKELSEVQDRCCQYLIILCTQLMDRMPSNFSILKQSVNFAPNKILNTATKPSVNDLPIKLLDQDTDLTVIENQLRRISFENWRDYFPEDIMTDTGKFWSSVYGFTDANRRQQYKELAGFALKILSLPISNAVVERVFSIMNATKTKVRNKMQLTMLTAIMIIRVHFHVRKMCCTSFVPSRRMFELFNAKMYETPKPDVKYKNTKSEQMEVDNFDEMMTLFNAEELGGYEYE